MSKAGKKRKAEKRRQLKRGRKEQRRALYKRYAEEGKQKGSRRAKKNDQKQHKSRPKKHSNCGNVGCIQCYRRVENLAPGRARRVLEGRISLDAAVRETFEARGIN